MSRMEHVVYLTDEPFEAVNLAVQLLFSLPLFGG